MNKNMNGIFESNNTLPDSNTDFLIENIKKYIEANIHKYLSLEDVAKEVHYNKQYIGKLFKKNTGKTIKEYYNMKRMEKAGEILKDTNCNVVKIATQLGFSNATYFNRVFKAYFSMAPKEWREKY